MENESPEISDMEWENRTLCSDGNCIGVIGPDGCCKECGKPYKNDNTHENSDPEPDLPKETAETSGNDSLEEDREYPQDNDQALNEDEDWNHRTLCSDGNCIGVIGADGRCKECGKPYEE